MPTNVDESVVPSKILEHIINVIYATWVDLYVELLIHDNFL